MRCQSPADLDRARAAGMLGWLPVNVLAGPGPALDAQITNVVHHPALAVWEGPDELVWNFTAYSGLQKSAGFSRADWQNQTDRAVAHAASTAAQQLPRLRAALSRLRALDPRHRPFWLNEAADSDAAYVRAYLDDVDVTGCDYYPVRSSGTDLAGVGRATDRWRAIGIDRPVWMVLQAFSWHAIHPERTRRYPTFAESRFMAFDALVHGARGLLYWGAETIDDPAFHASLLALTAEVASLEPWLLEEPLAGCTVGVIDEVTDPPAAQVRAAAFFRPNNGTHLVIVANEDPHRHLGVELGGLNALGLDDARLRSTDGKETLDVRRGRCLVRLPGHAVKVFTTDPNLVVPPFPGRDYPPAAETKPR